jgi:glycosyltransferase involved in cell wall biosynthesis
MFIYVFYGRRFTLIAMTPKTLTLVGDTTGCTLWRVFFPVTELQRQGYKGIEWGHRKDTSLANIAQFFDAIIIPRLHWAVKDRDKFHKYKQALHNAGITLIYEVDDDMFSPEFEKRLVDMRDKTPERAKEIIDCILYTLINCDGVTVSSQRLATIVRKFTDKPVVVVPNYIDLRWFKSIQKKVSREFPEITIGWAGGARPDADVDMMAQAWAKIAQKHDNVTFIVQGYQAPAIYDRVPHSRIVEIPWMPIETYPAGMIEIDIGCCPLADTYFNRAKTYIKALEYGASGAAVVASPTVYNQVIEHGKDGFICNTADEWFESLDMLVGDYRVRRDVTRNLKTKIRREHDIEKNAWKWLDAWATIIEDFRNRQRSHILLPKEVSYAGIQQPYSN